METININSSGKNEIIDITTQIKEIVSQNPTEEGICIIYCPHTTAGVTINENADPSVKTDISKALKEIIPAIDFQHMEGNSDSHIKSSLVGCSEKTIIENGELQLGRWQGIMFCEFDGPRNRNVWVNIIEK